LTYLIKDTHLIKVNILGMTCKDTNIFSTLFIDILILVNYDDDYQILFKHIFFKLIFYRPL